MVGDLDALRGRTVLVTGHSGFIGSWLCSLLVAFGADVVGYSLSEDPVGAARAQWLTLLGVTDVRGDVRDLDSVLAAARAFEPDVVVHLAAQPLLGRGFTEPHLTFDVNLNGSLSVLETVRLGAVRALVHVTSDKCYAPVGAGAPPLTEVSRLGGAGPYPASKWMAEALFNEFRALVPADSSIVSVRLGNVIGGGDEADRLVPNALRAFRSGTAFRLRDPAAERPFQHVLDVVWGLARLASCLLLRRIDSGRALNFAPPGMASSAGELVAELAREWGPGALVSDGRDEVDFPEEPVLRLDGGRAARLLRWEHRLDLTSAASWTVAWARMTDSGVPPSDATARQVVDFLAASTRAESRDHDKGSVGAGER
ncbi:NAD-dependent epimerase/dehydratase family protein [Streptomyces sp. LaBMicrA B280]|uniref:NAD-dependent epimerase/dehydratase family protein n=1 Tax=Streptomyces sp. LaBMicrA B280 TaxID=3391001 RepID=UPI003BA80A58